MVTNRCSPNMFHIIIKHINIFESHMFGTSISHIKTQKKGELCAESSSKMGCSPMGLIHFSPANCCCYDDQPNHGHLSATRKFENSTSFDKGSGETPLDKEFRNSQPAMFDYWRVSEKGLAGSNDSFQMFPVCHISYNGQRSFWKSQTNSCGSVSKTEGFPKSQDSNADVNMMINHRV